MAMSILVQEKLGSFKEEARGNLELDYLEVEWFETHKRILHKMTRGGIPLTLRFLDQDPELREGDILFIDSDRMVLVEIIPCKSIVLSPLHLAEASALCYEIGNRHLPLFIEGTQLMVPYEAPLFQWLHATGFKPVIEERKLQDPLKTTVLPHVKFSFDRQ